VTKMHLSNDDEPEEGAEGSCYEFSAPGQPTLYGAGTWVEAQRYAARLGLGYEARRLHDWRAGSRGARRRGRAVEHSHVHVTLTGRQHRAISTKCQSLSHRMM
jgi:hypothetical protein